MPQELRKFVLERTTRDTEFAFGVGIYAAFTYKQSVSPEISPCLVVTPKLHMGLGLDMESFFLLAIRISIKTPSFN